MMPRSLMRRSCRAPALSPCVLAQEFGVRRWEHNQCKAAVSGTGALLALVYLASVLAGHGWDSLTTAAAALTVVLVRC
jgi:hypothetical protein